MKQLACLWLHLGGRGHVNELSFSILEDAILASRGVVALRDKVAALWLHRSAPYSCHSHPIGERNFDLEIATTSLSIWTHTYIYKASLWYLEIDGKRSSFGRTRHYRITYKYISWLNCLNCCWSLNVCVLVCRVNSSRGDAASHLIRNTLLIRD